MDSVRDNGTGISVHGYKINNLKFADDIDLLDEDRVELQGNLDLINEAGEDAGLQINPEKTMTMVFGRGHRRGTGDQGQEYGKCHRDRVPG